MSFSKEQVAHFVKNIMKHKRDEKDSSQDSLPDPEDFVPEVSLIVYISYNFQFCLRTYALFV